MSLYGGKFGKFVVKLTLVEENLANISILRLKIIQQNWSISFKCVIDSLKKAYKTIVCDKLLNINAIESYMGLNLRS